MSRPEAAAPLERVTRVALPALAIAITAAYVALVVSWPFLFAVKVGQVGPFLLLVFAAGWRWLDRPAVVGAVTALGAAIKLQPGLLVVWLALTRRWLGLAAAIVVGGVIAVITTVVVGPGAWSDVVTLTLRVGNATT